MLPFAAFVVPVNFDFEAATVDECDPGFRARFARGAQSPLCRQRLGRDILARHFLHHIAGQIAAISFALEVEADLRRRIIEPQPVDPQPFRLDLLAGRLRQRLGQPRRIECRLAGARFGVHEDVFAGLVRQVVAVPKFGVALQPVGPHAVAKDLVGQRLRQRCRAVVVALGPLCECARAQPQQNQNNRKWPQQIERRSHHALGFLG